MPKPVCCVTHAQPLVGDVRLLRSVEKAEEGGHLRLLRLRNAKDGVTAVPAFSPKPSFNYVHVGLELKLFEDAGKCKTIVDLNPFGSGAPKTILLSRSKKHVGDTLDNYKAVMKLFVLKVGKDKQKRAHSLREHFCRLEKYETEISGLGEDLEDLCSRK